MLFNSFEFILLVLMTLVIYYSRRARGIQPEILIVSSFVFYAYGQPQLLALLIGSIWINVFFSHRVAHGKPSHRKLNAFLGVASNLFILAFFKYAGLLSSTFLASSSSPGHYLAMIPLPVGISFFTFQGISLLVDTFTGKYDDKSGSLVPESIWVHGVQAGFFISFFPQLVAGPIVKAHDFIPQIALKHLGNVDYLACFKLLTTGYFLKMFVADNLSAYTGWIEFPAFQTFSSIELLVLLFGYSMQIFADFAGYSLIAIGVARLFGYVLQDNFLFPYISKSLSEFWRRWHISLSSFLKEYLYIPLGGNRRGELRTYFNLMITMLLGGLWHGAAWSYLVWGGAHGLGLAVERYFSRFGFQSRLPPKLTNAIRMLTVFSFVTLVWLMFILPNFWHVIEFFKSVRNNVSLHSSPGTVLRVLLFSAPVIVYHLNYLFSQTHQKRRWVAMTEPMAYSFMLFLIITNSGSSTEFIYFQF